MRVTPRAMVVAVVDAEAIAVVAVEVVAEAMQAERIEYFRGSCKRCSKSSKCGWWQHNSDKTRRGYVQEILHALPIARALGVSMSRPDLRHL